MLWGVVSIARQLLADDLEKGLIMAHTDGLPMDISVARATCLNKWALRPLPSTLRRLHTVLPLLSTNGKYDYDHLG